MAEYAIYFDEFVGIHSTEAAATPSQPLVRIQESLTRILIGTTQLYLFCVKRAPAYVCFFVREVLGLNMLSPGVDDLQDRIVATLLERIPELVLV